MRSFSTCLLLVALGCGESDFDLGLPSPDALADAGTGDAAANEDGTPSPPNTATCSDDDQTFGPDPSELEPGQTYEDYGGQPIVWSDDELPSPSDADGYDATEETTASWCEGREPTDELCGTGVDEDCDGTVDEVTGVGESCSADCASAVYACLDDTTELVCTTNIPACINPGRLQCGDGLLDEWEQCDFAAAGEELDVTCDDFCRRPGFAVVCVRDGRPDSSLCSGVQVCSRYVGACVPAITDFSPRCPNLRVEGGEPNEYYPMIEVPGGDPHEERPMEADQCWITCAENETCPTLVSQCYMGFCVVPM